MNRIYVVQKREQLLEKNLDILLHVINKYADHAANFKIYSSFHSSLVLQHLFLIVYIIVESYQQ